jgi:hypothetical protein
MFSRVARRAMSGGVLMYVEPLTHLFEANVLNDLNILNVLNGSASTQRPDLLHARIEADVLILGRISQDPYRVFADSRSIDGFFDHRS